jgi:prepilin-type N-terminal cleavage/methylation domain-containing protein
MSKKNDIKRAIFRFTAKNHTAFSLAEMMVCLVIISVIAMSVSLALNRSQQRIRTARAGFDQHQKGKSILRDMADQIRWADKISTLTSNWLIFKAKAPDDEDVENTIKYYWNPDEKILRTQHNSGLLIVLASDLFSVSWDLCDSRWDDDNNRYIRSIVLTAQLTSDLNDTIEEYVHLVNFPYW